MAYNVAQELAKILDEKINLERITVSRADISSNNFLDSFIKATDGEESGEELAKRLITLAGEYLNKDDVVIDKSKLREILSRPKMSRIIYSRFKEIKYRPYGDFEKAFGDLAKMIASIIINGN